MYSAHSAARSIPMAQLCDCLSAEDRTDTRLGIAPSARSYSYAHRKFGRRPERTPWNSDCAAREGGKQGKNRTRCDHPLWGSAPGPRTGSGPNSTASTSVSETMPARLVRSGLRGSRKLPAHDVLRMIRRGRGASNVLSSPLRCVVGPVSVDFAFSRNTETTSCDCAVAVAAPVSGRA